MSRKKKEKNKINEGNIKHRKQNETNKVNQKRNYKAWSEDDMAAAVTGVKNGNMSQREASEAFKVPRSSLQDRLAGKSSSETKIGRPPILNEEHERKLADLACNRASLGTGFGKQQFMNYVGNYSKKKQIFFKKGKPSDHWWRRYKVRKKDLVVCTPEPTAAIRNRCMEPLKAEIDKLGEGKDVSERIWNMDETGVQLEHRPNKILARKGVKYLTSATSGNKETITIICAINAAGRAIPPHIIPKGKTSRALHSFNTQNAPKGTKWSVSEKLQNCGSRIHFCQILDPVGPKY